MAKINILGVEVEVTNEQAKYLSTELGNRGILYNAKDWHFSRSKGQWMKISEMATEHLMNAFIAEYKNAVQTLFADYKNRSNNLHESLVLLADLHPKYFEHSNALFNELMKRETNLRHSPLRFNP